MRNASHQSLASSTDEAAHWVHDMREILRDRLAVQDPWASAMAVEIVEGMRHRLGGARVYLPRPNIEVRNEQIRRLFNGRNVQEICRRFGVTKSTVYRVCNR